MIMPSFFFLALLTLADQGMCAPLVQSASLRQLQSNATTTTTTAATGETKLKVMGQSGKFTVYNSLQGEANGITVTMDAIREVDKDFNAVGESGSTKHSLNTFASQSFTVDSTPTKTTVNNLKASQISFKSPISTIGEIQVDTYIMEASGEVGPPNQKWNVKAGDLKWNIALNKWDFCNPCGSGNKANEIGAYVEVDISVKSPKDSKSKGNMSIDLGDGLGLELSNKTQKDGVWEDMPAGYPKVAVKGSSTTFTFIFPKFSSKAYYDPLISGMTGSSATTTTSKGASAVNGATHSYRSTAVTLLLALMLAAFCV